MKHKKNKQHGNCSMLHVSCSSQQDGFTLLEVIIYIAILSLVLLLVNSFVFYFTRSDYQARGDREVLENARRALEIITYEINGATSIYTPTTTTSQLSLETSRYLPEDESTTYIDFFICESRICLKKESQNPIFLTADTIQIDSLAFNRTFINGSGSIKINMSVSYKNIFNEIQPSVSLTSTASLRSY